MPLKRLLAIRALGREQMCLALRRLDASLVTAFYPNQFVGGRKLSVEARRRAGTPDWLSCRSGLWSRQEPLLAVVA